VDDDIYILVCVSIIMNKQNVTETEHSLFINLNNRNHAVRLLMQEVKKLNGLDFHELHRLIQIEYRNRLL
jgi:hypothetical protein